MSCLDFSSPDASQKVHSHEDHEIEPFSTVVSPAHSLEKRVPFRAQRALLWAAEIHPAKAFRSSQFEQPGSPREFNRGTQLMAVSDCWYRHRANSLVWSALLHPWESARSHLQSMGRFLDVADIVNIMLKQECFSVMPCDAIFIVVPCLDADWSGVYCLLVGTHAGERNKR